jgi:hypothetical protein
MMQRPRLPDTIAFDVLHPKLGNQLNGFLADGYGLWLKKIDDKSIDVQS